MSSDLDLLDRLRTDPAPAMTVDLAAVTALGRARVRRRRLGAAGVLTGAAAAVVAAVVALSGQGRPVTAPAATAPSTLRSSPATPSGSGGAVTGWQPQQPDLSGRATIRVDGGSYAVSVARGVMTVRVTEHGVTGAPAEAAVLRSGAVWRQVTGTTGQPVLVGVAPRGAEQVVYRPVGGGEMAPHSVTTAPAGDFTAYVIALARPPAGTAIARDVGWLTHDAGLPEWSIGEGGAAAAGFALDMAGEVPSLLPPHDVTVTGPPSTTAVRSPVLVGITVEASLGGTARLESQGGVATPVGPAGLELRLEGADPESAFCWARVPLSDGRTLVWGVLPEGASPPTLRVTGEARVGRPVAAGQSGLPYTPFAVLVEGRPEQVVGFDARLQGRAGGIGVLQ